VAAPSVRAIIEYMVALYGIDPVDPAAAAKLLAAAPPPPAAPSVPAAAPAAGAPTIGQLVESTTGSPPAGASGKPNAGGR
jgi:hypothetical protein